MEEPAAPTVEILDVPCVVSTLASTFALGLLDSISTGLSNTIFSTADDFSTRGSVALRRPIVGPPFDKSPSVSPTSSRWLLAVTLTLSVLLGAGVRAPNPGVRTVPGVLTDFGVRPAGVLAPDERAVPERLGLGVGASVSSIAEV